MRPINIRMSAFGPYAKEENICMDDLGTSGLYLITGDTGAGKTTIFDAICYALYGNPSGEYREGNMLRSKYADPDTPTEVELTFTHMGKEYRIKRNPEYGRAAKKGGGMTTEKAGAELYLPDGEVVTKIKAVDTKINEILGIDRSQFLQISMLAQGDFLKLLVADTATRLSIFRKLFKTERYETLQKNIDTEKRETEKEYAEKTLSVKQYISGIDVSSESLFEDEVKRAKDGELTTIEVLNLLDKIIGDDEKAYQKNVEEIKGLEKKNVELNKKIENIKIILNAKKECATLETELKEKEENKKAIDEKLKSAKEEYDKNTDIQKEKNAIEEKLPDYDSVDKLEKEIESLRNDIKKNAENAENKKKQNNELGELLAKLKSEKEELKNVPVLIAENKIKSEKLSEELKKISEIKESLKGYSKKEEEYKKAQDKYIKDSDEYRKLKDIYDEISRRFFDGQAGILAKDLKDGDACPVCGSKSHPRLAHFSDNLPTEEEVKSAKDKSETADKIMQESSTAANICKTELDGLESQLKDNLKASLNGKAGIDDIKAAGLAIEEEISKIQSKIDNAKKEAEELDKKNKRKEDVEEELPKREKEIDVLKEAVSKLETERASFEASLKEKENQYKELKERLAFKTKKDALSKIKELNDIIEAKKNAYEKAQEEFNGADKNIAEIKSKIDTHKKTFEGKEITDVSEDEEKLCELKEKTEAIRDTNLDINTRIENNKKAKRNIEEQLSKIKDIEEKYSWIKALADTANGNLVGKEKMKLETYIQTTYFDRIIQRANLRLMMMSSGQYELTRKKEAANVKSASGLELNVIDHYNGSERSVKTLSGGESFMASLSLALGLSDEIQSMAGGIRVDTMFVDEGFGTLDAESLDMAYKALLTLTEGERLVGIISHVEELKKIDKQIVVKKNIEGGSHVTMTL